MAREVEMMEGKGGRDLELLTPSLHKPEMRRERMCVYVRACWLACVSVHVLEHVCVCDVE